MKLVNVILLFVLISGTVCNHLSVKPKFEDAKKFFKTKLSESEIERYCEKVIRYITLVDGHSSNEDCLIFGDVIYTEEQLDQMIAELENEKLVRKSQPNQQFIIGKVPKIDPRSLWPNNTVYYYFDKSIVDDVAIRIRKAMDYWQAHTCLTFVDSMPRTPENSENMTILAHKNKIRFVADEFGPERYCHSYVGRIFWRQDQEMQVGNCQRNIGVISHEIGHALGLSHLHQRWDRDDHIKINFNLIPKHLHPQFFKRNEVYEHHRMPYDYGSIMHYGPGGPLPRPIIEPTKDYYFGTIGQRNLPSFLDIETVNTLYGCRCPQDSNERCQNGGYLSPRNCSTCICPSGFGGQFCEARQETTYEGKGCGETLNATRFWTTLSASFKDLIRDSDSTSSCFYHIVAPPKKTIQIRILSIKGFNSYGCSTNGIELKRVQSQETRNEDYRRTGARFCEDYKPFVSTTLTSYEKAIIHAFFKTRVEFKLQYRFI